MYQIETNPAFWAPVKVVLRRRRNQLETSGLNSGCGRLMDFNGYVFVRRRGLRSFLTDTIVISMSIIGEDRKRWAFCQFNWFKTLIAQARIFPGGCWFRAPHERVANRQGCCGNWSRGRAAAWAGRRA